MPQPARKVARKPHLGAPTAPATADAPRLPEVLRVSARLFREKGYRATSLADIAEALGFNKASLYYYVRSKQDLMSRIILRAAQQLHDASLDPKLQRLPPEMALEALIRTQLDVSFAHPDEFATLVFQRRQLDPEVLVPIIDRERKYMSLLRRIIRRGIAQGVFRRIDEGVATQLILDIANSPLRWYRADGACPPAEIQDEVWRFIRGALTAETRPS